MPPSAGASSRSDLQKAREVLERFLQSSRQPQIIEPGEDPFSIGPETHAIELRGGRLTIQAWDRDRNLVRRVIRVARERPERIELEVERFGKRAGTLILLDAAHPGARAAARHSVRLGFRERFRLFLSRQFPGWKIELTTEADLEHSLSPNYPRALLRQGGSGWAAIGAAAGCGDPSEALGFGLIWLDYLRRREHRLAIEGLALFLPEGAHHTTGLRLRCLNPRAARFSLFVFGPEGDERLLDASDDGNLDRRLEGCRWRSAEILPDPDGMAERIAALPGAERIRRPDGSLSLRVCGLEFARLTAAGLSFGIDSRRRAESHHFHEISALAAEILRVRSPNAADPHHPLYLRNPETWLESQVRTHLETIDAALLADPVYGQAPSFAGGDRGVIDLLAAERGGRLAVIELKASEDLHLPLQALDYWLRVRWHLERNEFTARGYFPGLALQMDPPRLLLVAPALQFHSTTETILRYFLPGIPVERIGLAVEWRKGPELVFRLRGARGA